jgi:hypothetical protein
MSPGIGPEAGEYGQLASQLGSLQNYAVGGASDNYRLYGDQVSFAGKQFKTPITLPNILPNEMIDGLTPYNAIVHTFESHAMLNMLLQVSANAQATPEKSPGPNIIGIWQELPAVTSTPVKVPVTDPTLVMEKVAAQIVVDDTNSYLHSFDPPPASDYVFQATAGSPLFSCITLPKISGVSAWNVRSQKGSTWSAYSKLADGGQTCFPAPGVNAVEFQPLNIAGTKIVLPDSLAFVTDFTKPGNFNGTLSASGIVPSAPSPVASITSVAPPTP